MCVNQCRHRRRRKTEFITKYTE